MQYHAAALWMGHLLSLSVSFFGASRHRLMSGRDGGLSDKANLGLRLFLPEINTHRSVNHHKCIRPNLDREGPWLIEPAPEDSK